MSGGNFKFSMVVRADVAQGKAALADFSGSLKAVSAEGEKVSASARKQAADLQAMAAATATAVSGQDKLAAAEKRVQQARATAILAPLANPTTTVAPLQAAFKATETSARSLQAAVAGVEVSIGNMGQELIESAAASRTYQAALDDLRAGFNPLFAASRAYEQELNRISDAEKLGAISAREAAAARASAANILTPTVTTPRPGQPTANSASHYTANIGAQGFDVGVTAAMGMNPLMIGLQQGSQLAGIAQQMGGGTKAAKELAAGVLSIFNPTSLVTIGLTTLAAVGIQVFASLMGGAKSLEQRMDELAAATERYKSSAGLASSSTADLISKFGTGAAAAKSLYTILGQLDRLTVDQKLKATASAARDLLSIPAGDNPRFRGGTSRKIGEFFDIPSTVIRPNEHGAEIGAFRQALLGFEKAEGTEAQIAAMQTLLTQVQTLAVLKGGISSEEQKLIDLLKEQADALLLIQGVETARTEERKRQTDQIVRGYQQETELAAAALQFGQDSAQLEQIRARHAREMLAIRLDDLGVAKGSKEWRDAELALEKQQAAAAALNLKARREWFTDQDDRISSINREAALIGASQEDKIRANALAEVEVDIRKRNLSVLEAEEARKKAIARAEAEITAARKDALYDTFVSSVLDRSDFELAEAETPEQRAQIAWQRAYTEELLKGASAAEAVAEADRVRIKVQSEAAIAQRKAMQDIATAGLMDRYDARIAAALDPHTRAAIEAEKEYARVLAETKDEQQAAAAADRVRARSLDDIRQAQVDYLRGQAESLQQMQLELALVSQTAEVRARVLAMAQAERDIQRLGLTGNAADEARQKAAANVELGMILEAQTDAWRKVQSAGEQAIDGILDKLRGGDLRGAFSELVGEIEGMFFDLAVRNPLKNMLMGTNLGTWSDVGGWGGIWGRLTGQNAVNESALVSQATTAVSTMQVMATNVTIGGAGAMSFLQQAGSGATAGLAMGGMGSLGGSANVQSQVWSFFAQKGMKPHQIAAIMGNISAESAFNPLAVGDNGQAFGLAQWNNRKGDLFNFIGGKQNLGDVQKQLEFFWHELMTTERGSYNRLMGSSNLYDATHAVVGFERPSGYNANSPTSAMHWDKRLAAAEAAMAKFEGQVIQTGQGVSQLGSGAAVMGTNLQGFGQGLQGLLQGFGAQHGPLGLVAGGFLSDVVGSLFGFETGGWTGAGGTSDVAGVVHREEYVFDAAATRRIGVRNLEALRRGALDGYMTGGHVVDGGAPILPSASGPAGRGLTGGSEGESRVVHEINVQGTGDRQIAEGVRAAIAESFDAYSRDHLPGQVRYIVNEKWGN